MRWQTVSATVSLIVLAKAVLIGWVALGRAEALGLSPQWGGALAVLTGVLVVALGLAGIAAVRHAYRKRAASRE